jgi:hypothetical protein
MKKILIPAIMASIITASCTKWDEYKKYTAGGEIVYAGKLDSVKVLSGRNRVMITGKFNADPGITKVRILWNGNLDSADFDVKRSTGGEYFEQTVPMAEGVTTFTIYTFDVQGNRSVPVTVVGKSYGDNYRKKISNRLISNIRYLSSGTTITWEPVEASLGAYSTELQYTVNGTTESLAVPAAETTELEAFPNEPVQLRYRAVFKPDSTCIDTFTVAYRDTLLLPFKNCRVPFIASGSLGRWGNLADWNANAAVQSHDGYGGWDEWNDNIFNVESGWGAPPITNG